MLKISADRLYLRLDDEHLQHPSTCTFTIVVDQDGNQSFKCSRIDILSILHFCLVVDKAIKVN